MEIAPDAFRFRGVVEGFYGKPWSHENRLTAIEYFAKFGMNLFIIGPKDAAWQRLGWRSKFSVDFLNEARELVRKGIDEGIEVTFSISPGLSVIYSDELDRRLIFNKFAQLADCGVTHFCLLWDDIDWDLQNSDDIKKYRYIEDGQADFSNWIYDQLISVNPNLNFTICPMIYWGRGNNTYLRQLSKNLNSRINIMWTGRQIRSEYLDSSDAEIFSMDANRTPLYWDNFPVNNLSLRYELHAGPVTNREANLGKHSTGLVSNPMNQFWASLLPLATVGRYLASPATYSPQRAWENSLLELFPVREDREAAQTFFEFFLSSPIESVGNPRLKELFTLYRNSDLRLGEETELLIQNIKKSYMRISSSEFIWQDLHSEIKPWLNKFLRITDVLEILLNCARGLITSEQRNKDIQAIIDSDRYIVCRDQIEEFLYESS